MAEEEVKKEDEEEERGKPKKPTRVICEECKGVGKLPRGGKE